MREMTVSLLLDPTESGQAKGAVIPRRQDPLHEILVVIDPVPLPHVGNQYDISREDAVGHTAANIRIAGGGNQSGARALADPEEADAARVGLGPALEVGDGRTRVADFVVG